MIEPTTEDEARRRIDNLRAVMAGRTDTLAPAPATAPAAPHDPSAPHSHKTRNGVAGGIVAAAAFLAGKLKFLGLLGGVLKLKTLLTMVLSIGLYASEWGLPFAVGFVVLIFIHEMGHWVVMRHEGIPAGAPVFIPFLGAFIAMRGMPRNAYVEAKVGIGGPIAGSIAAWLVLAAGLITHQRLLITLGHTGILLNLFNLIPVSPLDGGRIAGAFTRGFWIAGYAIGVAALVLTRWPLLLLVMVFGLFTLWHRWRHPVPGYDAIPPAQRLAVGLGYAALLIALALTLPIGFEAHPEALS
jgi:Zn-dependent protease